MNNEIVDTEALEGWADLWRYPQLAIALQDGRLDQQTLYKAVLEGLAAPVCNAEHAARLLIDVGAFAAAERLFGDREQLRDLLEEARTTAIADLERRAVLLARRAERSGVDAQPPAGVAAATRDRRTAGEALLDAWERHIADAERQRRAEIEQLVAESDPPLPQARRESIQRCLALGEFGPALRLARKTSAVSEIGRPSDVPRAQRWPWHKPLDEMLGWYFEGRAETTAEFRAQWVPPSEDTAAWDLLSAFKAVAEGLDRRNAERLIDALHRLLGVSGAEELPALVEMEASGGVHGAVSGLLDPRLPKLALPHQMPLWIAPGSVPPPTDPPERPLLWLVTDRRPRTEAVPGGVAIWDAASIFQLAAPQQGGRPGQVPIRRITAMRMICAQLRLDDLLGDTHAVELGAFLDLRRTLGWLFDLLGVHVHETALDILFYDTGEHRVALRQALTALLPDEARPAELTAEDVTRWHGDSVALETFRTRVLRKLASDAERSSVLHAALLHYRRSREAHFTANDIEAVLRGLQQEDLEPTARRRPLRLPSSYLYVPRALRGLASGLVTEDDEGFHLLPGGLRDLLSENERYLEAATRRALQEVWKGRDTVAESVQLRLTLESIRHLAANHLDSFRKLVREMERHRMGLPPELGDLITNAISGFEQFEDYRRTAEINAQEGIEDPRPFDLAVLLAELADERTDRRVEVTAIGETLENTVHVFTSRFLLKMALDNLILNAMQAITRGASTAGQVRLLLRDSTAPDGAPLAVIEIEDDGPGVAAELRARLEKQEPVSTRGVGGRGLPDARDLLAYCGGFLELAPEASQLGGAHFRVTVPVDTSDPS